MIIPTFALERAQELLPDRMRGIIHVDDQHTVAEATDEIRVGVGNDRRSVDHDVTVQVGDGREFVLEPEMRVELPHQLRFGLGQRVGSAAISFRSDCDRSS